MEKRFIRKEGLLMSNAILTYEEKTIVLDLVEYWLKSNKLQSTRNDEKISSSIIDPIIDVYLVGKEVTDDPEQRKKFIRKQLPTISSSNFTNLNHNAKKDLQKVVKNFLLDKQVESLSYEQQLFMLQWLRRLL